MNLGILLSIGINDLWANRLRSFLAMVGVIIAIICILLVIAIGDGHRRRIQIEIDKIGANIFWLERKLPGRNVLESETAKSFHPGYFSYRDLAALSQYATKINKIAAFSSDNNAIILNNQKIDLSVIFTEEAFQEVGKLKLISFC
jgi:putative ABC transport system permease protein